MNLPACLISLFASTALANTEKVVFLAPSNINLPDTGPSLQTLRLDTLYSEHSTLKKALPVAFPTQDSPRGLESWYLLDSLNPGQRYEVRVCWPAVQPTEFWLETFNLSHAFDTPALIQNLAAFAEQQALLLADSVPKSQQPSGSLLFLRVQAAADYFTTNKTLMLQPQPVDVHIILDPYLANIFPASLVPTAVYIILLAFLAFYISGWIWRTLQSLLSIKEHTA